MTCRRALLTAALIAVSGGALLAPAASAAPRAEAESRYVVQFVSGTEVAAEANKLRARGAKIDRELRSVFPGAVVRMTPAAAARLAREAGVRTVELDGVARTTETQTKAPWGLDRSDQRALPLDGAYSAVSSGAGVTAYVLDTGIRADHAEFAGRVLPGWTAISDGRGTEDCNGHGTHVAGTVGGTTYGAAKQVRLVPVRVLGCDGTGSYSGIIAGLDWVIAQHVAGTPAVANLSLGGSASSTLDAAVQRAVEDGVTVVVAAGNAGADACTTSPARAVAALTVGATGSTDGRPSWSNYGTCLDLFAPGVSVVSATPDSSTSTGTKSGTSMAAPHVAGVVAGLLDGSPSLTPAQVASAVLDATTKDVVTSRGSGSPNRLLHTVGQPATPAPAATSPSAPTGVTATAGSKSATVTWAQGSDGGSALSGQTVRVYSGTKLVASAAVTASATSTKIGGLRAGTSYAFTVTATNVVGTSAESVRSNTVTPTR